MGPAENVHNIVNGLIRHTILDVERVLKRIPQNGDHLDVISMPDNKAFNEVDISLDKIEEILPSSCSDTLGVVRSSSVSYVSKSKHEEQENTVKMSNRNEKKKFVKATAHILSDTIRVLPIGKMDGMKLDMMLRLNKKNPDETQLIDIRIECPEFKPNRIRVDGQWYNIV